MVRILDRVYGVDFFQPPKKVIHEAVLPWQEVQGTWEARTPSEWEALGRELQFTDVLVVAAWRLQLPEVARDHRMALYRVPVGSR